MTTILVTRHGETQWNTLRRMQGHLDSPLTEMGENQAAWLGDRLKDIKIDHIYSSPSGRAFKTAEIVNQHQGLKIQTSDALKEIYLGEWEGKQVVEIEAYDPERFNHFWHHPEKFSPKDSESFESVIARSGKFLEWVAETHPNETVLLVAHAVVLKSMIAYLNQTPLQNFWEGPFMNSTCLNRFQKNKEGWEITMLGDTSHFPIEVEPKWVHPK